MNILKSKTPNFLTEDQLKELKKNTEARKRELAIRKDQITTEAEFNNLNKRNNFDSEKLKKWLIAGVVGIFLAIIIWKAIGKFI